MEQEPGICNHHDGTGNDVKNDNHGDYEDLEEAHYSLQRQLGLPLSDPF